MAEDAFLVLLEGLRRGDFSRVAPFFEARAAPGEHAQVTRWYERGMFTEYPGEAAEALTCVVLRRRGRRPAARARLA